MEDFEEERKAVKSAIKECGHEPILAEEYRSNPYEPKSPEEVIKDMANEAETYIGIFDKRWGFEPPENNPPKDIQQYIKDWDMNKKLSVTAIEYYYVRKNNIPIIIFVSNRKKREKELKEFLKKIGNYHEGIFYYKYTSINDLRDNAKELISKLISNKLREFLEYQKHYFEELGSDGKALKDYYVKPTLVKCKMSSWYKEELTDEDIIRRWSIDEFLKSDYWLTIIGAESGMGKTSYCKYIAADLAEKCLKYVNDYIPIFIDLKNGFNNNHIYRDFDIEQLLDTDLLNGKKKIMVIT
ncbi:MAG: hypothetical protein KatS3mg003_1931 [Candidatus Nitrosocaldaceae archaeon]|nr:MAG: hypothetical protein KatS3mg003_1931 [Candidatus Nitrosocaldaceae archaeon]